MAGEEVSLWQGGQRRGRGYRASCKEEGAGLRGPLPLMTGLVQEELRREDNVINKHLINTADRL